MEGEMERSDEGNKGREMEWEGKRRFRPDTCHLLQPVELKFSVEDYFRRDEHIRAATAVVSATHQSHNEHTYSAGVKSSLFTLY